MSQEEAKQVAQRWFKALERGDVPTALNCLAENVEWVNMAMVRGVSDIIPWLGAVRGIDKVRASFEARDSVVDVKVFKALDLVVEGDQAFGTVHEVSVVKATGKVFDITFATAIQIRDGKIARWRSYCDPSAIVAAMRYGLEERLLEAVRNDDAEAVKDLLKQGARADARETSAGLTPLMLAACHGKAPIVKMLLEAGADVFTTDRVTGATALHKACQGGNADVARMLLDAGALIDAVTPTMGHTPIMDALWYKRPEIASLLVDRGANLHFNTHYGFTMMEHFQFELNANALDKGPLLEIDAILKAREAADEEQIVGQKVIGALKDNRPDDAVRFIQEGCDVNTNYPHINSFFDGHTPLLVAARDGHTQAVAELLKAGAKVNVADWVFKGAPVHKATYNGNAEILRMLLTAPGIDIDVQGAINGYTPLHDAIWHGYTECARILMEAGARLDLKGHDGKTPLDLAVEVYGEDGVLPELMRKQMEDAARRQAA